MKRSVGILTAGLMLGGVALVTTLPASADPGTLESGEMSALVFSREEEKMAHDLYTALGAKYDSVVWDRIAASETRHFDLVGTELTKYSIADPTAGKKAGQFTDKTIQSLYDGWLKRGLTSEKEAFKVAIELENRDIADLKGEIATSDNTDVDQVLTVLLNGSQRHLTGFTNWSNGTVPANAGTGTRAGQGPGNGPGNGSGTGVCDGIGQGRQGRGMGQGMGHGQGMGRWNR